ncbi:hypothetical protein P280DRAFT_204881 [Massarina eburnea CBS 473.64]|uniref:Uncharacterized protein n=1 Tax=Massarina eburnea CBS 473.64 TaxID=1395130 RepID=A0A6A6RJ11_9PLEO|nr:hypothetical protein P280DRAFT_204881 [Massarina eburnea CBS 473.64]
MIFRETNNEPGRDQSECGLAAGIRSVARHTIRHFERKPDPATAVLPERSCVLGGSAQQRRVRIIITITASTPSDVTCPASTYMACPLDTVLFLPLLETYLTSPPLSRGKGTCSCKWNIAAARVVPHLFANLASHRRQSVGTSQGLGVKEMILIGLDDLRICIQSRIHAWGCHFQKVFL